jgi:type I restriction enzyme S subunit
MELKTGYKNTEVGFIPEDWELKNLIDIGEIATGTTPPTNNRNNYGEEYFFVSPIDLGKGKYILDTEKKLSQVGFDISRKYPANSILFTCIGSTIGKSGISKVALSSNQQINAIFPRVSYSSDFLFYYLNFISPKIKSLASEQAVPMINKTEFGKTKIAIPNRISEQAAIATALSDMDELIAQTEKLIEKKKAIKQGVMQELIRPKEGWVVKKLGDYGRTFGGITGKTKIDFGKGNSLYIPFMNIMSNPIIDVEYMDSVEIKPNESQNKVQKGDLFFNGSSETPEEVGLCSVLEKDVENVYLNSFCFGYRMHNTNELNGLFVSYLFRSQLGRSLIFSLAQGATRYNLSKTNLLKLELPIPSKEVQDDIALTLLDIDNLIQSNMRKLNKLKHQKQGMMQALLTGKIRLI